MSALFEELDYQVTPIGPVSLRRRKVLAEGGGEIYEIILGDEFLMSSLFTASEIALARLGLAQATKESLDVVVGGLGLGCTAHAVLEEDRVRSLLVVEALGPVIEWHERGLVPLGKHLTADSRCRFVRDDFFTRLASPDGLDPEEVGRRFDAILVDIDHSPRRVLHPNHASLYATDGLRRVAKQLHPGGVFGLWSDDPPDEDFQAALGDVFATATAKKVTFPNGLQDRVAANTIYLANVAGDSV